MKKTAFPVFFLYLLLLAGCGESAVAPTANKPANAANYSSPIPQMSDPDKNLKMGENKMDAYILQLSMDLDAWTGKANARIESNKRLQDMWEKDAKKEKAFIPFGRDELIKYLKTKSEFADNEAVKKLDKTNFAVGKIETFGNLADYLRTNAKKKSVLIGAVTKGVQRWLGNENKDFYGGTTLEELWTRDDYETNGIQKLVSTFKSDDEYFSKCGNSVITNLDKDVFTEVKTISSFCEYLKPCDTKQ